jgi:release factor glutamine methyltransferase
VPRPETERLVELALERLPADRAVDVADLGTGSGAIALAIARERPRARVVATDASAAALAVASRNAAALGFDAARVAFVRGDWWAPLGARRFDLVASNPPYIAEGDPHLARGDLRFEPRDALASGADGLDAIRAIVAGAPAHLVDGGWLLLEHGFDQGEAVRRLLEAHGFVAVDTARDLEGRDRVTLGRRPG